MDEKNSFGNYLKYLREDYGYTLDELANTIGYSNAYLSQIEKGRKPAPSFEMLEQLSKTLKTPYSELLKQAGYERLAEGQYYKELFSNIRLNQNAASLADETSEELKSAKDLMNINFDGVIEWTKDQRFKEDDTFFLIEHFSETLLKYKYVIENLASANEKWNTSKDSLIELLRDDVIEEEIKRVFLKVELENNINDLNKWIDSLPSHFESKE